MLYRDAEKIYGDEINENSTTQLVALKFKVNNTSSLRRLPILLSAEFKIDV